jgi:hypothetical protein
MRDYSPPYQWREVPKGPLFGVRIRKIYWRARNMLGHLDILQLVDLSILDHSGRLNWRTKDVKYLEDDWSPRFEQAITPIGIMLLVRAEAFVLHWRLRPVLPK